MANPKLCAVEGCGKTVEKRGWCNAHYARWRRSGDANEGRPLRAAPGAKADWLASHSTYSGDDCLRWPYAYNPNGYAESVVDGQKTSANRAMCILAHGPAPSDRHEAAHTCGNGGKGCLNPRHLRWKTAAENQSDRVTDGTSNRGVRAPANKLSEDQVRAIRLLEGAESRAVVATRYGITAQAVSLIWSRTNWAWLE